MDPYPYQKRIPPFTTGKPVFKGLEHGSAGLDILFHASDFEFSLQAIQK